MKFNKDARKMIYECAVTIRMSNPDWTNQTLIEQSILKCGGREMLESLDSPIRILFPEYSKNPEGDISKYIK